jgi:hypothetical protein
MKRTILLIMLTVISLSVFAQVKVYKPDIQTYLCTANSVSQLDKNTGKWSEMKKTELDDKSNFIITFNSRNEKYSLDLPDKFFWVQLTKLISDERKYADGEILNIQKYNAVDQNLQGCTWIVIDYASKTSINFQLEYDDVKLHYQCHVVIK